MGADVTWTTGSVELDKAKLTQKERKRKKLTKELPVTRRVGLSLTGLWRLAIRRVIDELYLIAIEM